MLSIACPWCGPRDEAEFAYGGEAHIAFPADVDAISDAQWADYLYLRSNPKGCHRERWMHVHGCRRWFNVLRDTTTEEILRVYPPGSSAPDAPAAPLSAPSARAPDGST
jgi:heterotetrameric sarcosine oxidase delta subunit